MCSTKKIKFIVFFLSIILFFSCTDTQPKIQEVYPRVIYDYSSITEVPQVYISIFAEFLSEPIRIEKIYMENITNGLYWQKTNPVILTDKDKKRKFAGYSKFYPPPSTGIDNSRIIYDLFESGDYKVIYTDGAGQTDVIEFSLSIDDVSIPEDIELIKTNSSPKYLVYSKDESILYDGKKTSNFDSDEKLISKYPTASFYRQYYVSQNGKVLYLLPKNIINIEKTIKQDEE